MTADRLAALARLQCRAVSIPLGRGPGATEVLRRATATDGWIEGLVGLHGDWAGGGAVLAVAPLVVADPADPLPALAVLPAVRDRAAAMVGGGWFGFMAYAGPSRLAFYDHLLRVDPAGEWFFEALWSAERDAVLRAQRRALAALLDEPPSTRSPAAPQWCSGAFTGADRTAHLVAVEQAQGLIRAGELYQVNVCTRLRAQFTGSAVAAFAAAADALRPSFGAVVAGPERTVLSLSPELFLRRRGREVTTAPIKGTWPGRDRAGAQALRGSSKETAENVMIVDLMRNDLGRVCEPGSVRVPALFDVQLHPGVWHLVSTVTGRLRPEVDDPALLAALFPPGSVTGAPKIRATEVIATVESGPRGAYTGAIGFLSPCFGAEFAVAIRTFEIEGGGIELGVGGGITVDSVPMLEWQECLHKAAPLVDALAVGFGPDVETAVARASAGQLAGGLLETVLAVDGRPVRLADHLARLDRSSRELYGHGIPPGTGASVQAAARAVGAGRAAVRVRLAADGGVEVVAAAVGARPVGSAARTVERRPGLWRHKWADRAGLAALEAEPGGPLFVAPGGAVLETSRGNVFLLRPDGTLVTAPLGDDLLPGVTRRALLDLARDSGRPVQLREFGVDELSAGAAFWTSSLSGAVAITSVDGVELPRWDAEVEALAQALIGGTGAGRGVARVAARKMVS